MNISTKMIVALTIVSIIAGFALAFAYEYFKVKIADNAVKALNESIGAVIPGAISKELIPSDQMTIYKVYDKELNDPAKQLLGYAIVTYASGYQGSIKILVSVTPDFSKIITFRVLEHSETPGLGGNIVNPDFINQYEGLSCDKQIIVIKGPSKKENNEISAISGATISSRAVTKALNESFQKAKAIVTANE
ncbi:MAG: RnfABCDGE type electron transport complex subunit G [Spirochaetales bacterium]|nr:RnfABCDGE type electron transport complex subunit G [Exilispira sp.]NMC68138.1 RnfABCDGE type electron transport complex subunit G [Spirochaetales bacterium]